MPTTHHKPMHPVNFTAGATLCKALEVSGDKLLFLAAADSGPDRQTGRDPSTGQSWVAERIAPSFLAKMTKLAQDGKIELIDGHPSAMPMARSIRTATADELAELGYAPDYAAFLPVFKVDPLSSTGEQLWQMAKSGTLDREFSVGGTITSARVTYDGAVGGNVKEIMDGEVNHVAVCLPGAAANGRTGLLGAMMKALQHHHHQGAFPMPAPKLGKAYVDGCGEVEITANDIDEANEERAEWVWSTDFAAGLAQIKMQQEMPMMSELLMSVLNTILNSDADAVPDKAAAMKKAVDDFIAATENVTGTALNKTTQEVAVTAEGPSATPVHPDATQGGRKMSETMFKSLQGEGREKVAALLGTTSAGLDELTMPEYFSKAATLDAASQAALLKAMQPDPGLVPGDVAAIGASLRSMDTLAKSLTTAAETMATAAEKLAKSAEVAETETVAETVTETAATGVTEDQVKQMVEDGIKAALAKDPAESEIEELGKTVKPAELASLVANTVKEVLNKSRQPVGGEVTPEVSDRDRMIAMVKEYGPAETINKIFLP